MKIVLVNILYTAFVTDRIWSLLLRLLLLKYYFTYFVYLETILTVYKNKPKVLLLAKLAILKKIKVLYFVKCLLLKKEKLLMS